jgi:hypothetical protein
MRVVTLGTWLHEVGDWQLTRPAKFAVMDPLREAVKGDVRVRSRSSGIL